MRSLTMHAPTFRIACLTTVAALAACSGGGTKFDSPVPLATSSGSPRTSGATGASLTIVVPKATSLTSHRRHRDYVSPSSSTLAVTVNGGTAAHYGLSPNSPGCTTRAGSFSCTFAIVAPPGHDTLGLALTDAAGAVLSRNVAAVTVVAGASAPLSVTLAGVAASVRIVPGTYAFSDSAVAPYRIPGLFPVPIEIEALDADGNVIIGPGSPTISSVVVSDGASDARVASAQTDDAYAYVLSPLGGNAGGRTVTVTASVRGTALADGTTSAPVSGSTSYAFTPALAIASGPVINVASIESGTVFAQFLACGGACGGVNVDELAADSNGDLFVGIAQFTGLLSTSLAGFPSGSTVPTYLVAASGGVHSLDGLTVDAHDTAWVADGNYGNFISHVHYPPQIARFTFGATMPGGTIADTFAMPGGIAVDANGDVFESDPYDTATIAKYAPGAQTATATLSDPSLAAPTVMVADRSGGVYVVDATNNDVAYFAAGATTVTTTLSDPSFASGVNALMIDPAGDLWVSLSGRNEVEKLAAASLPNAAVITQTIAIGGPMGYIP